MNPEDLELLKTVGIVAGGTIGVFSLLLLFIKQFLVIGRPNELVVFTGRERKILRGGRSVRIPLLEQVDRMDVTTMAIEIKIRGAYAKGNIPVNVDAVANAKVTNDERYIDNAIERFLGKSRPEIRQVCRETLEGTLRGVLATLTPEQINHDRQQLAEKLALEVRDDLGKMGLMVDTLKIQHVSDDVNYLDSISRVEIAKVLRDAEIAESNAARVADQSVAAATSRGKVAQQQALATIAEAENGLSEYKSTLEARARSEEETTIQAGLEARATAEHKLQLVRRRLEALRLQAEQVIPAEKEREARELRAVGDAAIRAERGTAQAAALRALYTAWEAAGAQANEIFVIQQIDAILADVAKATETLKVDKVNLIDGGDGKTMARYVGSYPAVVSEILEKINDTVGVDIAGILAGGAVRQPGLAPPPRRSPAPPARAAVTTTPEVK